MHQPAEWIAIPDPESSILEEIAVSDPENPFLTPAYARSRIRCSQQVVAFLERSGTSSLGFPGFITKGRLHRVLEIPSAPAIDREHPLWSIVSRFCHDYGITQLKIQSFGSSGGHIPPLGREVERTSRREFTLRLDHENLPLSSNHRRNIKRAIKSGIVLQESSDPQDCGLHTELIDQSMLRRQSRGENATTGVVQRGLRAMVEEGAAKLFRARKSDGETVSSLLVLLSSRGGYYHSAGTSPEGMSLGASQFLIAEVAHRLRESGITLFNLGGAADEQTGLARFKLGFGAETIHLEAATADTSQPPRSWLVSFANLLGKR